MQEIAQHHEAGISVTDARPRSGATAALPGTVFTVRFALPLPDTELAAQDG